MIRTTLLLAIPVAAAALGAASTVAAQAVSQAQASAIDARFSRFAKPGSAGCAVGVYRGGKPAYLKGYGSAHLEQEIPATSGSIYQIGSVSKQFTAMALVLLEQDGKLSLDDDIHRFVPEVPTFGKTVTIRQMIQHTSGIRDGLYPLVWSGLRYPIDIIRVADGLDIITRQQRLEFDPGSDWSYSNATYWLLGEIVRRASGKNLDEFTRERIFEPLGMKKTSFHGNPTGIMRGGRTQAYERDSDSTYQISVPIYDAIGAGGLYTTVEDLAAWDRNFTTAQVGGKAGIETMHRRAVLTSGDTLTYAMGISISRYRGLTVWGHGGADGGYRAHLLRIPEAELGVAVLCNADDTGPSRLANDVVDIVLADLIRAKEPPKSAPARVELSRDQLASRVGFYRGERDFLEVSLREGKLRLGFSELTPLSSSRFQVGNDSTDVIEFAEEGGKRVLRRPHRYRHGETMVHYFGAAVHPTPVELAEYAGWYWSEDLGVGFNLIVRGTDLVVERRRLEPAVLRPATKDVFREQGARYLFQRDGAGRVISFAIDTDRAHGLGFVRRH